MPEPGSNFLNPSSIKIDPSLGVVSSGTTDMPAPAFNSETGEVSMPATIPMGKPQSLVRRKFHKFGPGGTLAERLGTDEVSEGAPVHAMPDQALPRPTEMPVPASRIVPHSSRHITAEEMEAKMKPNWEKEIPPEDPPLPPFEEVTNEIPVPAFAPHLEETKQEPKATKADLAGLVRAFIKKFGVESSQKFFGKSAATIQSWKDGDKDPTIEAVQLVIDKSPKAQQQYLQVVEKVQIDWETGEGTFSRDHTREELPVDLCICTDKDFPPYVHWVFVTAVAQYGLGQKMQTDTLLPRARNMVAQEFLKGKAQWSIWLDYDILPTIGNAPWWRAITRDLGNSTTVSDQTASYDFIKRLLAHNKPFVGGVYATRRKGGPMVTQLDLHPRNKLDREASESQRKNKAQGLYGPVEWLSTGFACIHRVVFETIMKRHPEVAPKTPGEPYPFFTQLASEGEDYAFSQRAREAGFKLYLDQELFAAHIGRYPFLPGESAYNGPVDVRNAQT